MSCCGFQSVIGIGLEEQQLLTSNQLFSEILTYSNINSNGLSNLIIYNSNNLSNLLQPQIKDTSNLIYKDQDLNTIIHLTAQNPFYPILEGKEIRFHTAEDEFKTKINQDGELEVYHTLQPIPVNYPAGWWNVEEKLTSIIQEEIGLRFDVVNLQTSSGVGTITNEAEATAAAIASGAGLVGLGGITGAAATTIAGGDYGSVALGIAGGALFSVLGYLSYQAQVGCNLSNLGFSNQFSNVNSNMSNANLLLTSNLYSISRAQGFINCNILSQQFVNNLRTNQITLNNKSITSFSLSNIDNFVQTQYGTYYDITNGTLAINSTPTQEDFFRVGGRTTIQGELICEGKIKENNLYLSNVYTSSNVLSNTSNTIFNNYSNEILITSNNLANYTSNNSNYFSNLNLNSSNNLFNYSSNLSFNSSNTIFNSNQFVVNNYTKTIIIKLPNTNYTYDGINNVYIYDLDISKYVPYKLIQQSPTLFIKTRIFRITTFLSTDFNKLQFTNLNNITGNAICYPETLLIYMSNDKNTSGIHEADDNYCNGLVYGKQNPDKFAGYWNIIDTNFNYLRFITGVGFDIYIVIEPILF